MPGAMSGSILRRPLLLLGALALFVAPLAGCLTQGVKLSELPHHPIAITYYEPEDARRRADLITQGSQQPQRREGVARLDHLGMVLGVYDPRRESPSLAKFPGYLALVDPRTKEIERVAAATPGARPLGWSSDGMRLLFSSGPQLGRIQLFEYNRESGLVARVTAGEHSLVAGAYGPDRRLVYSSLWREKGRIRTSIHVTGPYGSLPELLSRDVATDALAWSPLGSPLLYVRRDTVRNKQRPMLVSWEAKVGSEPRDLGPGRDPVFTPDGEWIVFSAPVGDGWRLRRMRPDGSGRTRVGWGTRDELQPAVSPDSGYVAYIGRDASEIDRLYVRRMDGSGDRILITSGGASSPAW